jgi:hypothetical protein
MTARTNFRQFLNWEIIGVTPLPPGWINTYRGDDGTQISEPAPALLLEEATTDTRSWDEQHDGKAVPMYRTGPCERATRVVFASSDCGELVAANDSDNYEFSTTQEFALRTLDATVLTASDEGKPR